MPTHLAGENRVERPCAWVSIIDAVREREKEMKVEKEKKERGRRKRRLRRREHWGDFFRDVRFIAMPVVGESIFGIRLTLCLQLNDYEIHVCLNKLYIFI